MHNHARARTNTHNTRAWLHDSHSHTHTLTNTRARVQVVTRPPTRTNAGVCVQVLRDSRALNSHSHHYRQTFVPVMLTLTPAESSEVVVATKKAS